MLSTIAAWIGPIVIPLIVGYFTTMFVWGHPVLFAVAMAVLNLVALVLLSITDYWSMFRPTQSHQFWGQIISTLACYSIGFWLGVLRARRQHRDG